jgi:UDPglucose--hexose-1-phosphate uridylyltransferase
MRVSFLWHLHQPCYRTADGVSHAPWAALHAGGAYRTLASAILDRSGAGQVVNIVPTLLEQLLAYRDGTVNDPVLESILTPAGDLSEEQRKTLVGWAFHVTPKQMDRYPRLLELGRRRRVEGTRLAASYGPGDLRDLQILFVLAQAGEQAWRDPRLQHLAARGRGFARADHDAMVEWLRAQPGELIELWQRIARLPGVEIATSPYAHPIMPLLADTGIVVDSWAPSPPPEVPAFRRPDDAAWQLEAGLTLMGKTGFEIQGCWPPEGSVSAEALEIYAAAGIGWLVTDEGILERSLGRPLRKGDRTDSELYRPWRLSRRGPVLFFRDRLLSDAVGFRYGRWDDETEAARALVDELHSLGRTLSDDATVVLALDGENPWLHYPDGGGRFLRELMSALDSESAEIQPETLSSLTRTSRPATLEKLHPGSWINGVFATWIGHPEKTAGWRLLAEVREAIESSGVERPPSLLVAEASDWFWWLGDDNPTDLAPLYDTIFRRHLEDACRQAGVEPPESLRRPLKTVEQQVEVPMSELRFCPIRNRWAIIAPERRLRPHEFVMPRRDHQLVTEPDPFAPGNEDQTPTEILSLPALKPAPDRPWQVRVFANKYPALRVEGRVHREGVGLNDSVSGVGAHEVIVECPEGDREMADLEVEELVQVLEAWRARIVDLRRDTRLRYVLIFKNRGREAGASVAHAHSQLIATPIIPTVVVQELDAARDHFNHKERCIFCDLVHQELELGARVALESDQFVALNPFASALPFETWVLPKRHLHDFAAADDSDLRGLSIVLGDLLRRVRWLLDDPPYNLVLHTAPSPHPRPGHPNTWSTIEHDYHWHLELVPRITRRAGFEWGSGYTINPTSPESAAHRLNQADPSGPPPTEPPLG